MALMSPSGGANEYDSDPLGLGATVEYVEVLCMKLLHVLMRVQSAQHGPRDQSVVSLSRACRNEPDSMA
jgi:hypothetical protein